MDPEAMVRYLAGALSFPAGDVDRTLRALTEYLESRGNDDAVDVKEVVQWIVERTMLPWGRVERTIVEMLTLSARLDAALGQDERQ